MKKVFLLFALCLTLLAVTNCSDNDTIAPKKNYYGVEPTGNGVSKNAYLTLFGSIVVFGFIVIYVIKKVKNNK
jgi:hypothetical protein